MNNSQLFRHILVIEDRKTRRVAALEKPIMSIGREASNDIVLFDKFVSRHHATLLRIQSNGYAYRLIDGDLEGNRSTNGLLVNGHSCQEQDLKHGDSILFGSQARASYYILSNSSEMPWLEPSDPITTGDLRKRQREHSKSDMSTCIEQLENLERPRLVQIASFPELSPYPIIEINLHGQITYTNPAAKNKFSNLKQAGLEHPVLAKLLDRQYNAGGNLFQREVKAGQETFEQYVHYLVDGEQQLIRSYLFEITGRKQLEEQLQYRAFHDELTALPNQTWFNEQLSIALANAQRYQYLSAVLFLDLDNFKNINTIYGHPGGNQILESFAQRLKSCLRAGDTVARWGGDEFTLLLPRIEREEDTITLAKRILQSLESPFELAGDLLHINTSIGIAVYPRDGEDGETLIKNADAALFQAKEDGRHRYRFYNQQMTSKASLLLKLENLLHQALENDEFSLHYQPQVRLKTGEISGMEALLRWRNPELINIPELRNVSLSQLIALAEKTDLIIPLSEWVLRTACQQNKAWQEEGLSPISMAVNFSPRQFRQSNLVEMVEQVLTETRLDPQWLEVEITETSIMQDVKAARRSLHDLQHLGVLLSMDDFGTGYSSLSYLQNLPFDTLKIDRSFVLELADNTKNTAIISAVIALGRSFNLRVVAEGVETPQQLELLQRLQCEEVQGYLFSYPLEAEDATQFLTNYSQSGQNWN